MRRWYVFCLCLCLTSCSSNKYGDHPPYPVFGQISINGQPAPKGVQVVFFHEGDWGEKPIVPMGATDDEGKFEIQTYGVKDGAPAGDYKVKVEWPAYRRGKNVGPDKFGKKYSKPETSGLTAHVEKGTNQLKPFELTISPPQEAKNKAVDERVARKKAKIAGSSNPMANVRRQPVDPTGRSPTDGIGTMGENDTLPGRIVSLDQFRGYTVAGMLLVNFLGGFRRRYPPVLKHHNTYCSYADTIMPQFFFAVGFAYRLTFLRRRQRERVASRLPAHPPPLPGTDPAGFRGLSPRRRAPRVGASCGKWTAGPSSRRSSASCSRRWSTSP